MFDCLPGGQEVAQFEPFEHLREALAGAHGGLEIVVGRVGHSSKVRVALRQQQEQVRFSFG